MKKLLILFIFIILLSPIAHATMDVTFVTGDSDASSCSALDDSDEKWFCERLEDEVGYDVTLVHENNVVANNSNWKSPASTADLIFLGDIDESLIRTDDSNRAKFCNNLAVYAGSGKAKLFATFASIYNDTSNAGYNKTGCALAILGVSSVYDDNICSSSSYSQFKKNMSDYPTNNLTSTPTLLSPKKTVTVHGSASQGLGWVDVSCNSPPPGASYAGDYAVVSNTSAGVFWGLTDTSSFTNDAKNFFDRMVWYILDDTSWTLTGKIIPSSPTVNESIILVSKVTLRGNPVSSGTVNYSIDQNGGITGSLSYSSASTWWEKYDIKLPYTGYSRYNITAYSGSDFMGSSDNDFAVGNLTMTINSGDYVADSTYKINATVSGTSSANMYYRIFNKTDYSSIANGAVDSCSGSTCTRIIDTDDFNEETVILEVIAQNSTLYGGAYKLISTSGASSLDIQTDEDEYAPGDTIEVDVYTTGVASMMNLSVIDPEGTELLENSSMTQDSSDETHWSKSYTLGDGVLNGTYEIEVYSNGDSPVIDSEEVDVIAWSISASLDHAIYEAGDDVEVNVTTSRVHDDIDFTIQVNITDPDDDVTVIEEGFDFSGNGTFSTDYTLPNTAVGGEYEVDIYLNDSYDRIYEETLEFTLGATNMLQVTPSTWEISTEDGGYFTQEFTVENIGNETLYNLSIYADGDLEPYLEATIDEIEELEEDETETFEGYMTLNTEGSNSGSFIIENSKTRYVINVTGTYSEGAPKPNEIVVAPTTLSVVLPANKKTEKNFSLATSSTDGAENIAASVIGDIFGIVTVKSKPDNITIGSTGSLVIETNTQAQEPGSYTGSINITSTAGFARISPVTVDIIPDLSVEARAKIVELEELQSNITSLRNRGKNTTEIENLYNTTKSLLNSSASAFEAEDYDSSKIKYELALSNIQSIKTKMNKLETEQGPQADYSIIIWVVAIVVVVAIVGIVLYKNKDKIKKFIEKQTKKKEQPKQEDRQDYYEPVGGQGGYRTEYY